MILFKHSLGPLWLALIASCLAGLAQAQDAGADIQLPGDAPIPGPQAAEEAAPAAPAEAERAAESEDPAAYRALIEQAVAEYAAQHFEEASALFLQAHALLPNARTLRGLGMTEFERRHYVACIVYLERALTATERPLDDSLRRATETLLARARTFVSAFTFDVTPASARVWLDAVELEPAVRSVMLQVGEHTVTARADGYIAQRQTVSVPGGGPVSLSLHLEPTARPTVSAQHESKGWWQRPWLWVGASVVVASVAAGIVIASTREAQISEAAPEKTDHTVGPTLQALAATKP